MTWTPPEEWINVYDSNGSWARVFVSEESEIDAAVTRWIDEKKDSILHLRFIEGEDYCILASEIKSWYKNTKEFREREAEVTRMIKDEQKARGEFE